MLLSERDCHRCRSLDMRPAVSKARTPRVVLDFLMMMPRLFVLGGVARTESKLLDMVFFTLTNHVSSAMIRRVDQKDDE